MRKLILTALISFICVVAAHAQAKETGESKPMAVIEFEKTNHKYRSITYKGPSHSVDFKFTNTGDAPLVILRTEVSCTCLTTKFPRKPIPPGESGIITVIYTPKKDYGKFRNTITVRTNTADHRSILFVEGEVKKE